MKFKQAFIAENLYEKLSQHFNKENESIKVIIEGAGVHWHCIVAFQNKACKIHCFEDYNQENPKAEYLIIFKDLKETKAHGRTNAIEDVLTSSAAWVFDKGIDFIEIFG